MKRTTRAIRESRTDAAELDMTNQFLKSIRRGGYDKQLSREEELELGRRWKEEGDIDAKRKLMAYNQLLVFSIARNVCKNPAQMQDFVDEGMIGLSNAIDHYDITRGTRLSTIAYPWIRKVMIEYLYGDAGAMVRRPHNYQIGSNVNKINAKFFAENGRYPELDELQDLLYQTRGLKIPMDELVDVCMSSMNAPVKGHDDDDGDVESGSIGDIAMASASRNNYEAQIENDEVLSKVEALLNNVDPRTRDILKKKFGIAPYDYEWDDEQIADSLGLTKTRVQQLINGAYKKLRNL